ncbi:putative xyloglucan glycosyltransferase 12 [Zea mays]|uniref:Putative xyloglucan glycosyltransferase 12 n=1 Tax=Zea mays TaxID=4577 RepID=A0A1D6GAQ9_MAIZE|nr:putative xyloglucan glycosyltransferase 12 [Zea mays]
MPQWWGREARGGGGGGGTSVVVKMESPDWAVREPEAARGKAGRGKNARQITWVLLLKAHRAAGKLTGAASAALSVAAAARRRVAAGRTDADADAGAGAGAAPHGESPALRTRLYGFLRASLVLSMLLLAADVAAHLQGWHLLAVDVPDLLAVEGLFAAGYASWVRVRLQYLAPALQFLANACVLLFLVQSADRLILCLGCLWIKLRGIKPVPNAAGKGPDDVEAGTGEFPMVLVQIPMCNEKEVYQQSIGAVCGLDWPRPNFLVQVLDDSDDAATSALIKEEVERWQREGVRILYRHRVIRDGYKAGNLKSAMNCSYVKDYEFVVIFDADFQPQPDFLKRTVPHFKVWHASFACIFI